MHASSAGSANHPKKRRGPFTMMNLWRRCAPAQGLYTEDSSGNLKVWPLCIGLPYIARRGAAVLMFPLNQAVTPRKDSRPSKCLPVLRRGQCRQILKHPAHARVATEAQFGADRTC